MQSTGPERTPCPTARRRGMLGEHRRHCVLFGKPSDLLDLGIEQSIDVNHQCIGMQLSNFDERLVYLAFAAGVEDLDPNVDVLASLFDLSGVGLGSRVVRVDQ
jgi:hypothetical protein